ncbi:MAG: glycosyltransferase [Pseudomonadota bacterium]
MRIIVPIHSFEPGGVERIALYLAQAWQRDGADVRIVLGRRDGAMQHIAPELDYVIRPSAVPTAAWETPWMIFCLLRYLLRHRGELADSVIFAAGNTYAIVGAAMKLLLGRRCPRILLKISNDLERRDLPAPARFFYHLWLRIQGALLDHFVAMAPALQPEIVRLMHVLPERVSVIEDAALAPGQFERLAAIDRPEGAPRDRLVTVGRLAGQKNQQLMVRALANARAFTGTLTICGAGAQRRKLERIAADAGLGDRVVFAGHCRDVTPFLAEASALVLSSDYEGLPAVVIEAMAAGLPVISTDCSAWIEELLQDRALGILVPRGDLPALSSAFSEFAGARFSPQRARAMAGRFTVETAAPAYRAVLARIAACAKPAGR